MSFPIGQTVHLTLNTYSDAAQTTLADPTTVSIDLKSPDGTVVTYTLAAAQVVRDSLGKFHFDLTPAVAGHYEYHWYTTGAVTTSQDGTFDVRPKYDYGLVSLTDVKKRLNIDLTDESQDDELIDYLDSATTVLQNLYGDVIPTQYTERLRPFGDGTRFLCGRSPLVSVDSITVTWNYLNAPTLTLAPTMYRPNLITGEVQVYAMTPAFSWQYAAWDWSLAEFDITYTAGRKTVAPNVKDAVLEILRINYKQQRAGGYYPNESDDEAGFTVQGYYIPNSAHERLTGGERPRQIA